MWIADQSIINTSTASLTVHLLLLPLDCGHNCWPELWEPWKEEDLGTDVSEDVKPLKGCVSAAAGSAGAT